MATTTTVKTKGGVEARLTNLQAGVNKDFSSKTSVQVAGVPYTEASLDSKIAAMLALYTAVTEAKTALGTARAAVKAGEAATLQFLEAAEAMLKGFYGPTNPILADFGIALPKARTALTPEQLVVRSTKAAETRVLRGTKGPKAKAAIKSTSTVTVTAQSSAATAPAAASAATSAAASAPASAPTAASAPASAAVAPAPAEVAATPAAAPAPASAPVPNAAGH